MWSRGCGRVCSHASAKPRVSRAASAPEAPAAGALLDTESSQLALWPRPAGISQPIL